MVAKKEIKVCFGMPLYNNSAYLIEAMDSILGQTYADFAIIAIDDHSTDDTEKIMLEYAAADDRISFYRNKSWEGLISNWRKTFVYADTLYSPKYFAWISDHDRWDKEWLEKHVTFLESHNDAALVYPETVPIDKAGSIIDGIEFEPFDTYELNFNEHIFRICNLQTVSGNAIYGLFRSKLIKAAGIFRNVLLPDRLLLTEVSAYGKLKQLPEKLWYRRFFNGVKPNYVAKEEQRSYLFGSDPAPLHSFCPYLSHILSLIISFCIFPANGNYKLFFRGLEIAGLIWERARKIITSELDEISRYLKTNKAGGRSDQKAEPLQEKENSPLIPYKIDAVLTIFKSMLPDGKNSFEIGSRIIDMLLLSFLIRKDTNDRILSMADKQLIDSLQLEINNLKAKLHNEKQLRKRLTEEKSDWTKQIDETKVYLEQLKGQVELIAEGNNEKSVTAEHLKREIEVYKTKLHEQKIIKHKLKVQLKAKNEKEKELRLAIEQACQHNEADHLSLNRLIDEVSLIRDEIRELNKPHTYDDIENE